MGLRVGVAAFLAFTALTSAGVIPRGYLSSSATAIYPIASTSAAYEATKPVEYASSAPAASYPASSAGYMPSKSVVYQESSQPAYLPSATASAPVGSYPASSAGYHPSSSAFYQASSQPVYQAPSSAQYFASGMQSTSAVGYQVSSQPAYWTSITTPTPVANYPASSVGYQTSKPAVYQESSQPVYQTSATQSTSPAAYYTTSAASYYSSASPTSEVAPTTTTHWQYVPRYVECEAICKERMKTCPGQLRFMETCHFVCGRHQHGWEFPSCDYLEKRAIELDATTAAPAPALTGLSPWLIPGAIEVPQYWSQIAQDFKGSAVDVLPTPTIKPDELDRRADAVVVPVNFTAITGRAIDVLPTPTTKDEIVRRTDAVVVPVNFTAITGRAVDILPTPTTKEVVRRTDDVVVPVNFTAITGRAVDVPTPTTKDEIVRRTDGVVVPVNFTAITGRAVAIATHTTDLDTIINDLDTIRRTHLNTIHHTSDAVEPTHTARRCRHPREDDTCMDNLEAAVYACAHGKHNILCPPNTNPTIATPTPDPETDRRSPDAVVELMPAASPTLDKRHTPCCNHLTRNEDCDELCSRDTEETTSEPDGQYVEILVPLPDTRQPDHPVRRTAHPRDCFVDEREVLHCRHVSEEEWKNKHPHWFDHCAAGKHNIMCPASATTLDRRAEVPQPSTDVHHKVPEVASPEWEYLMDHMENICGLQGEKCLTTTVLPMPLPTPQGTPITSPVTITQYSGGPSGTVKVEQPVTYGHTTQYDPRITAPVTNTIYNGGPSGTIEVDIPVSLTTTTDFVP